jgi:hypothetical protein
MPFSSGTLSFRRFAVVGKTPKSIDQDLLDALKEHAIRPREIGVPEEIEYGWCGARHILDSVFSFENTVFADGLHFALRIDTNKVPAEVKSAYRILEEESLSASNASGFLSRAQKREAKQSMGRKIDDELRSGKYRRSKLYPVLWDIEQGVLYCNISAPGAEKLLELFDRTFDLRLEQLSSGALALRKLEKSGKRREYEDAKPTRFAPGPEGDSQQPDYPWVMKGDQSKDFFGNEFLLWLWHASESAGDIATAVGAVNVVLERTLDLDCAYGATGRDTFRAAGVTRMPEAIAGLRTGKVPRRAGVTMHACGMQVTFALSAEHLAISGLVLPNVEEADSERVLFEERIAMLRTFSSAIDALYGAFLEVRASSKWTGVKNGLRKWIQANSAPGRAVAAVE